MKITKKKLQAYKRHETKTTWLYDGRGLCAEYPPEGKGNMRWRFRYRINGKEKRISFGTELNTTLEQARQKREAARKLVAEGVDPSAQRQKEKSQKAEQRENTFESVAEEWFEFQSRKADWVEGHKIRVIGMLKNHLYPSLASIPIAEITPHQLRELLNKIEQQGKYSVTKRVKNLAIAICSYGVATSRMEHDISFAVRNLKFTPAKTKHRKAVTDPKEVGELLLATDGYEGSHVVHCALRFISLVFVRSKEIRLAEWNEVDWDESEWRIDASKMKMRRDHIVPLSRQAIKILQDIHERTGNYRYIFPSGISPKEHPMGKNALRDALYKLGYKEKHQVHGFRAMFRTLASERLEFNTDWVRLQLAHKVSDPLGEAYDRASYLERRHEMMQTYADYLDKLKAGAVAKR
ncbi:MAG: integrase arm-type DNA-binding domain-containing protein [Hyphomicrobiales bacterium]|nr:integrase arm-type DNA-binding domain-containing protein [Hyphomicrobiales bacterium]